MANSFYSTSFQKWILCTYLHENPAGKFSMRMILHLPVFNDCNGKQYSTITLVLSFQACKSYYLRAQQKSFISWNCQLTLWGEKMLYLELKTLMSCNLPRWSCKVCPTRSDKKSWKWVRERKREREIERKREGREKDLPPPVVHYRVM